ncbi:MAG: PDZ domain-containing protein [Planctomycetota bacterium]
MRPWVAAIAVLTLAGATSGRSSPSWSSPSWSSASDDTAPGVRDRPASAPPSGPGRKGSAPARPASPAAAPGGGSLLPGETAPRRRADHRAREQQDAWRTAHPGSAYRYGADEVHRIAYATCLDEQSHADMLRMLAAQADQQAATLFDALPDVELFVAVATPADVRRIFADNPANAGMYEHPLRRIVTADIGTVLRHEWTHAMHFGHMERLGQPHAMWVQEGLAALYESYELTPEGGIRFLPTDRHNQARRLAGNRRALPVSQLVSMSPDEFMGRSQACYPMARSVFEFMADQGKLRAWYRRYVETFAQDRTGRRAIEDAFAMTVDDFDRAWRAWALARPAVDVAAGRGDRQVGVEVRAATDGVEVTQVERGSAADRAGIRRGDVILEIDGVPVRSPREWAQATGAIRVPEAPVTFRRGADRRTATLEFDRQAKAGGMQATPAGLPGPEVRGSLLHTGPFASEA